MPLPLNDQSEEIRRLLTEANLLRLRGQYDEAIGNCMRILGLDPADAGAHSLLGDIYHAEGNDREALGWYKLAVQMNPANVSDRKKLDDMIDRVFKAGQDDEASPYASYTGDDYSAPVVSQKAGTDWLRQLILKLQPIHVVIFISVLTMITVFIILALRHNAETRDTKTPNAPSSQYPANPGNNVRVAPGQYTSVTMSPPSSDIVEIGATPNKLGLSSKAPGSATIKAPTTGLVTPVPKTPIEPPKPPLNVVPPAAVPGGGDSPGKRVTAIRGALNTLGAQGSFLPQVVIKRVGYDNNNDKAEIDFTIPDMGGPLETKRGLLYAATHIATTALLGDTLTDSVLVRGYTSDGTKAFLGEVNREESDAARTANTYEELEATVHLPWWREDLNELAYQ